VLVILGEEIAGTHATPHPLFVLLANLPWLLFPLYIIYSMWRYPYQFTMPYQVIEEQVPQSFPAHTGRVLLLLVATG